VVICSIDAVKPIEKLRKATSEVAGGNLDYKTGVKSEDEVGQLAAAFDKMTEETNQYEQPAIGNIKGMQWKGKADILCDDCIIDLKTTSNINDFKWSARKYNYDSQCYIYQQLFGRPLVFYVIDKNTKMLGVYEPSDEFVHYGEMKVEKAIEVYNKFFGDNPTEDINSFIIEETL